MKSLRSVIAAVLVAIYAVATFGYDLSVTLCHCAQSEHIRLHHSHDSHNCHDCQHHNMPNDGISASHCCNCSHDHSLEIDIYDKTRIVKPLIKPLICNAVIPVTFSLQTLSATFNTELVSRNTEELPDEPDKALFGLRAPPVLA